VPYKDRSLGLIIFGVMTALLGCLAELLALFTTLSQSLVPKDQQVGMGSLVPAIGIYVVLGAVLIWLGIGSIMARRWARALLLIFSWSWLILGVVEMAAMAFFFPKIMANMGSTVPAGQPAPPAAFMDGILVFMFLFLGFFFVLLPGIWTFFYYSPHVKATCEARDPALGWTDACPLPVLALSLWMWLCVPMMALVPLSGHLVVPFFGMFLTGVSAIILCAIFAAVWGTAGWLLYRLHVAGWWLSVAGIILGGISTVLTFSMHDFMEIYRLGNYPQAQIDQIQKLGLFQGGTMAWMMALFSLPFLGYLIFVKRYFPR
jgi:hypothetical protein